MPVTSDRRRRRVGCALQLLRRMLRLLAWFSREYSGAQIVSTRSRKAVEVVRKYSPLLSCALCTLLTKPNENSRPGLYFYPRLVSFWEHSYHHANLQHSNSSTYRLYLPVTGEADTEQNTEQHTIQHDAAPVLAPPLPSNPAPLPPPSPPLLCIISTSCH